MLDIRQPAVGDTRLPAILAPFLERRIVEQQHVSRGTDQVAGELAVVAVAGHEVDHPHPRFDAGEAQHIRRMIQRISLDIGGGSSSVMNRIVIRIGRVRTADCESRDDGEKKMREKIAR